MIGKLEISLETCNTTFNIKVLQQSCYGKHNHGKQNLKKLTSCPVLAIQNEVSFTYYLINVTNKLNESLLTISS